MKKYLLAFFGELRDFEFVIPLLEDLDKVDIIVSTWSISSRGDTTFEVNEDYIKKILPNVKQVHIINNDDFTYNWKMNNDYTSAHIRNTHNINTQRIIHHWKTIINNLKNLNEYDNIIFHRTDLVSSWNEILNQDIEKDTIYLHTHDDLYANNEEYPMAHWCNDYYFYGKIDIVKKFINNFNEDYTDSHYAIYKVLTKNNIRYKRYVFRGSLYKNWGNPNQKLSNTVRISKNPTDY